MRNDRFTYLSTVLILLLLVLLGGCRPEQPTTDLATPQSAPDFTIRSGSENKDLEPLLQSFAHTKGMTIQMTYAGSLAISQALTENSVKEDAVWPASSLWLRYAGKEANVHDSESISRTPVILGIKKSKAAELGWIGKPIHVADILKAAQAGKLRYMMTSASQSNSGASAYLSYLYAFAGHPQILTHADLDKPAVKENVKAILGTVNRSAGSSGFLLDLFLDHYDDYDGMVNYETLIIQTDQKLIAAGREPLYAIYPVDGLAIADSPLAYVDHGDAKKKAFFTELVAYLRSPAIQKQIASTGRRTGAVGLNLPDADPTVFNPDWGIDTKRTLSPITFPDPATVHDALNLYQSAFRKPSVTIYCLDFSGSMGENGGAEQLKAAMHQLLDQEQARKLLLQAAPNDRTVVLAFSSRTLRSWNVVGNDSDQLQKVAEEISALTPDGGTNIYGTLQGALGDLSAITDLEKYSPAIVLMTDGQDNGGMGDHYQQFRRQLPPSLAQIPIYCILFGDADPSQLNAIAHESSGKVFDGRSGLGDTFREVKGYN